MLFSPWRMLRHHFSLKQARCVLFYEVIGTIDLDA
jgi:hypothetical protein